MQALSQLSYGPTRSGGNLRTALGIVKLLRAGATTPAASARRLQARAFQRGLPARIAAHQPEDCGESLSNTRTVAADQAAILRMIQAAKAAAAASRGSEADELLARAARAVPGHPAVLNEQGLCMMQRGEAVKARELFQRATRADPNHPAPWSNLASSLHALRRPQEEMEAIERALAPEPRHLNGDAAEGYPYRGSRR